MAITPRTHQLAIDLLRVSAGGAEGLKALVLSQLTQAVELANANRIFGPSEQELDAFLALAEEQFNVLETDMALVFAEHFEETELQELLDLLSSPVYQRFTGEQPVLQAKMKEIGAAWGKELAEQVDQKIN